MRAIEEKERKKKCPGESLQHECSEAIKNITRHECNSVYLAMEEKPRTISRVVVVGNRFVMTGAQNRS